MTGDPLTVSLRVFRQLLRLYPSQFRSDYGDEMLHVFRHVVSDEYTQGGARSLTALWLRTVPDLVVNAADEHIQEGGVTMRSNLIRVFALAGLASGALLIAYSLIANMRSPGIVNGPHRDLDDIGIWFIWGLLLFAASMLGVFLHLSRWWSLPTRVMCLLAVFGPVLSMLSGLLSDYFLVFIAGYLLMVGGLLFTGVLLLRQQGMQMFGWLLLSIGGSCLFFNSEDARVLFLAIAGMLIMALSVVLIRGVPQDRSEPPLAA
ncbi:MAG: hypothetical protein HZB53_11270 [Chloroflexi bacterium]|nr:hypothetical protein [Chloroflexota bacterium]